MDELSAHLTPYRPQLLDEGQWDLAVKLLRWSMEFCRCRRGPQWHAREAFYATVYALQCAPAGAQEWQTLLNAKYVATFFVSDDVPSAELNAFIGALDGGQERAQGELGAHYRAILDDLTGRGIPTEEFEAAFRRFCAGMTEEQLVDPTTLSLEDYLVIRTRTIAVMPHLMCWKAVCGVSLSPAAEIALRAAGLVDRCIEANILANDMASVERDMTPSTAENRELRLSYVLLHARQSGDLHRSILEVTELYRRRVEEFRQAMRTVAATAHALGEPDLLVFVEILRACVDGNLASCVQLAGSRYQGSASRLGLLPLVGKT